MRTAIALLGFLIICAVIMRGRGPVPVTAECDEVLLLELRKTEAVHEYWEHRRQMLRAVHQENHRDVMDAELNLRLSWLDMEIARILASRGSVKSSFPIPSRADTPGLCIP